MANKSHYNYYFLYFTALISPKETEVAWYGTNSPGLRLGQAL